jgi:hypothetical protein
MKINRHVLLSVKLLILLFFCKPSYSNNSIYEQRKEAYIDSCLASASGKKLILQVHKGLPLDTSVLNSLLTSIPTRSTSDFIIIEMIRILFLTNGEYDSRILPVLNSVPYWINYGDTLRGYWSENHMIMWMSSDWLLHERYNKSIDNDLRNRLVHYLELKNQYGFYEFFSSTYAPYAFSGLVNLADFSQDIEIKNLAAQAAQRLLSDLLLLTSDKGVFFPVAGRNYPSKYTNPYGENHNDLVYLLTGFGEPPLAASASGPFLATSSLEVDNVIDSWQPEVNMVYNIGHTLQEGFALNSSMSKVDKVVFQWSSGAYFHPEVVMETANLLVDSNMWKHVDFKLLEPLSSLPIENFPNISRNLDYISQSTLICGQEIAIFKNHSITLSSILDFWKGKVGFQQYPCVANIGTTAVFTSSGEVKFDWQDRNSDNQNIHLPYVAQQKNVSLIMYKPEPTSSILGTAFTFKDVALHFKDADYDEIFEDDLWLLGRQEQGYVAVRRNCVGEINGVRACPTTNGQTWVIVVGDSLMYGSFSNFKNAIQQSNFEEAWYTDSITNSLVYYAKIEVDSVSIDYAWGSEATTGIKNVVANSSFLNVYPNPTDNVLNIDFSNFKNETVNVKVYSTIGEVVYNNSMRVNNDKEVEAINTSSWPKGIYMVMVENKASRFSKKIIKAE